MKKILYIFLFFPLLSACTYDFPEVNEPDPGNASFEKYVAVGTSISAGFMDAALYDRGQRNSFPNILAQQFEAVGGGEFTQPDIDSENGFAPQLSNLAAGVVAGRLVLSPQGRPVPTQGQLPGDYSGSVESLNNFGVPGILTGQLFDPRLGDPSMITTPFFNPYYSRIASSPGSSTLLGDALTSLQNGGTFFTLWIGNNDVLAYALGGAANPDIFVPADAYSFQLSQVLQQLLSVGGVNGAIANIPDVTAIPFFTTIPYNLLPLDAATVEQLEEGYADFNRGVAGWNAGVRANPDLSQEQKEAMIRPFLAWNPGQNPPVIIDEDLSDVQFPTPSGPVILPKYRMLQEGERIRLDIPQEALAAGLGTLTPVEDKWVLTKNEMSAIQQRVDEFNQAISAAVSGAGSRLALVDMHTVFENLRANGAVTGGISLTSSLAPPFGAFSLDGVHPNGRGNAYLANQFIAAINRQFKSEIPMTNPNNYPGNDLPQ